MVLESLNRDIDFFWKWNYYLEFDSTGTGQGEQCPPGGAFFLVWHFQFFFPEYKKRKKLIHQRLSIFIRNF